MRRNFIVVLFCIAGIANQAGAQEKMLSGKFEPTWKSLQQYSVPEWFRDAKFGIWAHWGPQCEPESGDWYGKGMYVEGSRQNKIHLQKYGHPSEFGFKDVCHVWRAEKWDPDMLVKLYKKAGARYFFAMANHHDNLDLWDSKYQPWNSVMVGPRKNIIDGWAKAARKNGLYFGASVHASHAWTWYEPSQLSDSTGGKKGVSYDGRLLKKNGKGKWWDGLDPQDLYAQNHAMSRKGDGMAQWDWGDGASIPSTAYCEKYMNRTIDLINKYNPDMLYFDDTALPLWPVSDVGLKIAAHFYNHNMATHQGYLQGVIFGKILTAEQKKALVWDVERGAPKDIQDLPWQTCTCIGNWHYDRSVYDENRYKSAKNVVQILADVVSKNGNLLLNIPVRGNGTIDEKELEIVEKIGKWMDVNAESIYETRPWKVCGEGPTLDSANPMKNQGFNEGKLKYSATDIRFTSKKNIVYAIMMEYPTDSIITLKSFAKNNVAASAEVKQVELLGKGSLKFANTDAGLVVYLPATASPDVAVLKIFL